MSLLRILLLALALPLGCASPTATRGGALEDVDLRARRPAYAVGDTAEVVLRNGSDQDVGYNLCLSAREQRVAGGWRRFEPLRVCTAALYTLSPGAETVLREPITSEWEPGEYRMVTRVEPMRSGAGGEVFTPPFTVAPR